MQALIASIREEYPKERGFAGRVAEHIQKAYPQALAEGGLADIATERWVNARKKDLITKGGLDEKGVGGCRGGGVGGGAGRAGRGRTRCVCVHLRACG